MNGRLGVPTLLGIPFDGESSYLRGAGNAPPKIRAAMACDASNSWTELGVDLDAAGAFDDAGMQSCGNYGGDLRCLAYRHEGDHL